VKKQNSLLLLFTLAASALAEPYGPFNLDGGKIACNDDRGPEIKKTQVYAAPADRFFVEKAISVSTISGWGKAHSCQLTDVKKKSIQARTDYGQISVDVVYEFSVFAHADCGSGWANNMSGKTASIECSVSAEMQKYTNQ
jgi:hypothetical protein